MVMGSNYLYIEFPDTKEIIFISEDEFRIGEDEVHIEELSEWLQEQIKEHIHLTSYYTTDIYPYAYYLLMQYSCLTLL